MLLLINIINNTMIFGLKWSVLYFELVMWVPVKQLALVQMKVPADDSYCIWNEEKLVKTLVSWSEAGFWASVSRSVNIQPQYRGENITTVSF